MEHTLPAVHEGPHTGAGDCLKAVSLKEACTGAVCCWEDCNPQKGSMFEQFIKSCSPGGRTNIGEDQGELSLAGEMPHCRSV